MCATKVGDIQRCRNTKNAGNIQHAAKKYIEDVMNGSMADYKIASVKETEIMDVFEIKSPKSPRKQRIKTKRNELAGFHRK